MKKVQNGKVASVLIVATLLAPQAEAMKICLPRLSSLFGMRDGGSALESPEEARIRLQEKIIKILLKDKSLADAAPDARRQLAAGAASPYTVLQYHADTLHGETTEQIVTSISEAQTKGVEIDSHLASYCENVVKQAQSQGDYVSNTEIMATLVLLPERLVSWSGARRLVSVLVAHDGRGFTYPERQRNLVFDHLKRMGLNQTEEFVHAFAVIRESNSVFSPVGRTAENVLREANAGALAHGTLHELPNWNARLGIIDEKDLANTSPRETPEEMAQRKAQEEAQAIEEARVRAEEARLAEAARQVRVGEVTAMYHENTRVGGKLRDMLAYDGIKRIQRLNGGAESVVVALGNAYELPSAHQLNQYRELVKRLVNGGKRIIYDADSKTAEAIAAEVGTFGFGVTAHPERAVAGKVVYIENAYMRMKVFSGANTKALISPDSVLGSAIIVSGKNVRVFDPSGRWTDGFNQWVHDNPEAEAMGLADPEQKSFLSKRYETIEATAGAYIPSAKAGPIPKARPVSLNFDGNLKHVSESELNTLVKSAQDFVKKEEILETMPGGAALFCSKKSDLVYGDLVYDFAHTLGALGTPVAHGGSGGLMDDAAAGAYDAGASSIGIPMGAGMVRGEEKVAHDKHTVTLFADGYEQRIALLLHRRQIIGVGPGGRGSMAEVATTLTELAAHPERSTTMIFLSERYYGGLVKFLHQESAAFASRVTVVDDGKEVERVANSLLEQPGYERNLLVTQTPPTPRTQSARKK